MIKENQPEDGINFMRKSWTLEGFEENIYLPQGWIFKENSSKNSNGVSVSFVFTTNMGEVFKSFRTILDMMKSSEDYTKVDINKVRKFMLAKSSERRKTVETWEDDKNLPNGWKFRITKGENKSKENTVVAPSKPKKEKKTEAMTSELDNTARVEGKSSLSPHGLEKVNEPSKISPNQGLSSSDKRLLEAKTMAFPFQHGLTQTEAHFKFKDKQKRTNKFVSIQVSLTAKSIQDQRSQNKDLTKPNLQLQLNRNQAGIIETKSEPRQGQPLANKKHVQRSYIVHNIVKVLAFSWALCS